MEDTLDNMSNMTYIIGVNTPDKPIVWLSGEVKTPPFSSEARIEAGFLLRHLQHGDRLSMPQSRPMPTIGKRCHELRIKDRNEIYRIIYRIDPDAILVLEVFKKKSRETPQYVVQNCRDRIKQYDAIA